MHNMYFDIKLFLNFKSYIYRISFPMLWPRI